MNDMIVAGLNAQVPFAAHAGVTIRKAGLEGGEAVLAVERAQTNHIGSVHAGALFTLGEAASGAAMAGAFADMLAGIRPVAAEANIRYLAIAKGDVAAKARIASSTAEVRETLEREGKARFAIDVELADGAGKQVAQMKVDWHLSRR